MINNIILLVEAVALVTALSYVLKATVGKSLPDIIADNL